MLQKPSGGVIPKMFWRRRGMEEENQPSQCGALGMEAATEGSF